MTKKPGKAIIYARFSPRPDAGESESIEKQLAFCRDYCAQQKLQVVGEYEDRALSGGDEERPGLWNAIDALKREYILLAYDHSRLARDVYLSELIQRETRKKGAHIQVLAGAQGNGDTPEQSMIRQVLQAFAEYQRKVTAARTKAVMLRHQAEGRRMSYRTPYGWKQDPDNPKRLIEDKDEQEIIKRIVRERQTGKGFRQICRDLTMDGMGCRGGPWYHQTVKSILKRQGIVSSFQTP